MVWIFKTSVNYKKEIKELKPILNNALQPKDKWNFDLEDCDNILRIEADTLEPKQIEKLLNGIGYKCVELIDKIVSIYLIFPICLSLVW